MSYDFEDKIVLITGASRGIGRETALCFSKRGSKVLLTARNQELVEELKSQIQKDGGRAWAHVMDVTSQESVNKCVDRALEGFGHIDVLVNNAGILDRSYFIDKDISVFLKEMETNYFGIVYTTKRVLPSMIERKSGAIVNVSSVIGKIGTPMSSSYCATKFAVLGFTQSLRGELKPLGINVMAVLPPLTDTDMANGQDRRRWSPKAIPPQRVAEALVKGVIKGKREVFASLQNRFLLTVNRFFPAVTESIVFKVVS